MSELQSFLFGSAIAYAMGFLTCFVLTLGYNPKKRKR